MPLTNISGCLKMILWWKCAFFFPPSFFFFKLQSLEIVLKLSSSRLPAVVFTTFYRWAARVESLGPSCCCLHTNTSLSACFLTPEMSRKPFSWFTHGSLFDTRKSSNSEVLWTGSLTDSFSRFTFYTNFTGTLVTGSCQQTRFQRKGWFARIPLSEREKKGCRDVKKFQKIAQLCVKYNLQENLSMYKHAWSFLC